MSKNEPKVMPVHLMASDAEYKQLGISKEHVEPWEDGLRSDPSKIDYEWWYFDTELEDGSKIVIVFYTKPYTQLKPGLTPQIDFTLTRPNGANVVKIGLPFAPADFKASKEHCDVHIGKNYFTGDLKNYKIHVEFENFACDVNLKNSLRSWRPGAGIRYYGDKMFNWVMAIPNGETTVNINNNGKKETLKGVGYHDHNWGDAELMNLIHDWYWGRGKIGDYFTVFAYVHAEKEYGYSINNDFLLAKNGKIVADNGKCLTFIEKESAVDKETGKPYGKTLIFDYAEDSKRYQLIMETKDIIERRRFHDAKDGAYLRFSGNAVIKNFNGNQIVDESNATAIWEMMYFGLPLDK